MQVWLKRLAWLVCGLFVLWVIAWLALPSLIRWQAPPRLSEALGRPVTMGAFRSSAIGWTAILIAPAAARPRTAPRRRSAAAPSPPAPG